MMRFIASLLLLLPSLTFSQDAPPTLSSQINSDYFRAEPWTDGLAEVATYDSVIVLGGEEYSFDATAVIVLEDYNTEFYAVADWPHGQKPILPVVRRHYDARVDTVTFPYSLASDVVLERDAPRRPVRLNTVVAGQDGIVHKELQLWRERPLQRWTSFRDGEGSGERHLRREPEAYFEEELSLLLRAFKFEEDAKASFRLYSPQLTSSAKEPQTAAARLSVSLQEQHWLILVETNDQRAMEFQFDVEPPHLLRRFSHSDGRSMTLRDSRRISYLQSEERE